MKRTAFFGIVTLFMLATLSAQAQTDGSRYLPSAADGACRQWVDSVFSRMSLHEKVGQLLVPKVMAEETKENKKAIKELVKKDKVGGLLFGVGTSEEQAILTNLAQSNAKVPLMITFDGEWGPAMRLKDVPSFPRNAALGCIADNGLIEAYGREVARQLRELGVVVNFAPVVDVNTNPLNPVIHVRSFGENPQQVAEKAVAYGRGLEAGGVLSVAKHFPGHGDTDSDSHKVLPVVWGDRHRLDSIELYPFKAMAGAGLGGVMVAHLQVPAIEPDSVLPSSLSHRVITGLLKEELGFEGLVFTDALDMKGVTGVSGYYTKAVLAGNDMLLVQFSAKEALNELVGAVRSGELPEALINEKCRKVLTYKYLLGLRGKQRKLQISGLSHRVNTEEACDLASRLRKASVTVLNNYFDVLPLATGRTKIAVLSMGGQEAEDSAFVSAMQQQGVADVYRLPWNADGNVRAKVREALMGYNRVVVSLAGFTYINDDNVAFLANLNLPAAMVYACFTSYRPLSLLTPALEKASAVVLAHSAESDVQAHVAQVLFGKARANGRLSMSIGRLFPAGTGCDIVPGMKAGALVPDDYGMKSYVLQRIDQVALKGLQAGAYPGCRILVLKDGHTVYDKGFGVHSPVDSTRVRVTDMFDLASLTKTTATLLAVMKLYDEGKLKLEDKASKYLSFLRGTNKRNITIRELLLHESGLPPYIRFYVDAIDPHSVHGPYAQSWKDEWHQTQVSEHSYYCSDFKFKRGMMADKESATHGLHLVAAGGGTHHPAAYGLVSGQRVLRPDGPATHPLLALATLHEGRHHAHGVQRLPPPAGPVRICPRRGGGFPGWSGRPCRTVLHGSRSGAHLPDAAEWRRAGWQTLPQRGDVPSVHYRKIPHQPPWLGLRPPGHCHRAAQSLCPVGSRRRVWPYRVHGHLRLGRPGQPDGVRILEQPPLPRRVEHEAGGYGHPHRYPGAGVREPEAGMTG